MLKVTSTGFIVEFENGYSVSVRWSSFHYCEHRDLGASKPRTFAASRDAEVAVITPRGEVKEPKGWQTADQVARIIASTQRRKRKLTKKEMAA